MAGIYCYLVIGIIVYIIGYALGLKAANKAKDKEQLTDPEVYEIERRLYWLENIDLAYNKIQEIFDENKDKFECLKLEYENQPYHANRFYCRYRSFGNKYVIRMCIEKLDMPVFKIEENKGK